MFEHRIELNMHRLCEIPEISRRPANSEPRTHYLLLLRIQVGKILSKENRTSNNRQI